MSTFAAQQITRTHTIHLSAASEVVFPLFSPLGEKHWEPDWNPAMLYPVSGAAQIGTVFTTQHTDEPVKIWTIVGYDREQMRISYLNVAPTSHLSRIDIGCEAIGTQATSTTITYTLTALTPQGNAYLERFTEEHYQVYIASWQRAITHYLAHGQPLAHPQT